MAARARAYRTVAKVTPVGRVLLTRSGKWWAIELPTFPDAYSQGRTQAEAYLNLLDALAELVKANKTLARRSKRAACSGETSSRVSKSWARFCRDPTSWVGTASRQARSAGHAAPAPRSRPFADD
jgi:predicted RNase H-like HicB family nuclease